MLFWLPARYDHSKLIQIWTRYTILIFLENRVSIHYIFHYFYLGLCPLGLYIFIENYFHWELWDWDWDWDCGTGIGTETVIVIVSIFPWELCRWLYVSIRLGLGLWLWDWDCDCNNCVGTVWDCDCGTETVIVIIVLRLWELCENCVHETGTVIGTVIGTVGLWDCGTVGLWDCDCGTGIGTIKLKSFL